MSSARLAKGKRSGVTKGHGIGDGSTCTGAAETINTSANGERIGIDSKGGCHIIGAYDIQACFDRVAVEIATKTDIAGRASGDAQ